MVLKNTMVLDFARLLPGPYATSYFVELGAEVIKVEEPGRGDYLRNYGTNINGISAMFNSINRGKKSISVDLHSEEEKEKLKSLVAKADFLVESYRPGFMKRVGLDYESVKKINPKIIYCSISGFGQTGTLSNKPGHDLNYLGYSGLLDVMMKGKKDKEAEDYIPAIPITDIGASLNAINAMLTAYINRINTGEGQYIDISIVDGIYSNCMQLILPEYIASKQKPTVKNNSLFGRFANYCIYETKDNKKICVAAEEPQFWKAFCEEIGRPDFIAYLNDDSMMINIRDDIKKIIKQKSCEEWMDVFDKRDACVSPVIGIEEICSSPQVREHDLLDVKTGNIYYPIKFSTIKTKKEIKSPRLGEHTKLYMGGDQKSD